MSSRLNAAALAVAVLFGACGPEGDGSAAEGESAGTEETTASLLSSVAGQGTMAPGRPVAPATQEIDIAILGHEWGSITAPVRVVEFSDYGCGYCRQFHQETWPVLFSELIDAGKVEWKFLPFISGMFQNSLEATTAAECVLEQNEDLFEAMHNRIWEGQKEWKNSSEPARVLRGWVGEVGADVDRFDQCVLNDWRSTRIQAATGLARQLGVRATPTFFVVGYPPLQGALPTDIFLDALNRVYADATKAGGDR